MAACSGCRGKKVPFNYRTLCLDCAAAREVCPQCCEKEKPDANPEQAQCKDYADTQPAAAETAAQSEKDAALNVPE